MDNSKTGALIKAARKEKGLTQLELAQRLHISDRAVSKWERGLCAPDIALLEPLCEALDLSITELISGQRRDEETERAVKEAITYSKTEVSRNKRGLRLRIVIIGLIGALLGAVLFLAVSWYRGDFYVLGRYPSPNGETVTTAFSRKVYYRQAPQKGGFTLSDEGFFRGRSIYSDAEFDGLWWSPNGQLQVVSMTVAGEAWEDVGKTWLVLTDYKRNVGSNLDARLGTAIYGNELFADVPWDDENYRRFIEYEFIQWSSADPEKMLIYFYYTDVEDVFREGYFWYDYESGLISGEMEIEQGEKKEDFRNGLLE